MSKSLSAISISDICCTSSCQWFHWEVITSATGRIGWRNDKRSVCVWGGVWYKPLVHERRVEMFEIQSGRQDNLIIVSHLEELSWNSTTFSGAKNAKSSAQSRWTSRNFCKFRWRIVITQISKTLLALITCVWHQAQAPCTVPSTTTCNGPTTLCKSTVVSTSVGCDVP